VQQGAALLRPVLENNCEWMKPFVLVCVYYIIKEDDNANKTSRSVDKADHPYWKKAQSECAYGTALL
jgi:hypothetical protein